LTGDEMQTPHESAARKGAQMSAPNPLDKRTVVVFSGAGLSAESGIPTFRDSNGLWENHRVEDVASPRGWQRNPALVLRFYIIDVKTRPTGDYTLLQGPATLMMKQLADELLAQ